jgi:nucleotide-binding universal stress UspA family protein
MTSEETKRIICAVRGGPESRDTVTHAVNLALETGATLTFFRVMDAEFLEYATVGPLSVVYRELSEMAKFALLILCDRAQRRGVAQVDCVVREGNIQKQLRQFLSESPVDVLVMGRPTRSPGSNTFKPPELDLFVDELKREQDLRVVLVTSSANVEE